MWSFWSCGDDENSSPVAPGSYYEASSRGVCLLTQVSATIYDPVNGETSALPYTSSGTSYSQFAVIDNADGSYQVTCIVS